MLCSEESTLRFFKNPKGGTEPTLSFKTESPIAEQTLKYSDDLDISKQLYPKKALKTELHHPFPKYMGGAEKQELVPLNGSYHQMITNEFFKYWPKKLPGQLKTYPTLQQAQEIMQKVYSKYPLIPDH